MKNLFSTLFFAFLLVQVAQAQGQPVYEVHPNPSDTITTSDTYDSPAHGEIWNISPNPINIRWERTEVFLTPNITTAVCDPVTCWFQGVSTKQFQLLKDSMGQLTVHFYNNAYDPAPGQAGSGIVHLKLTNLDNPTDTMTGAVVIAPALADDVQPGRPQRLPVAPQDALKKRGSRLGGTHVDDDAFDSLEGLCGRLLIAHRYRPRS